MASVFEVMAKLTANTASFEKGMSNAEKSVENLEKEVNQSSNKMSKSLDKAGKEGSNSFGASLKKLGGIAAGAAAAVGAVDFFGSAVNSAVSFEAEFEGVNQVFGEGAEYVQNYAKQAADLAGVSETVALRSAKSFGQLAVQGGLAGEAMGKFSTDLVQAAGDLGSFYDMPTEQVLGDIQSAFQGQFEPLRKYQMLLSAVDVENKAVAMGLMEQGGAMSNQAKIMATNALVLEGLGVAQGDFVKYQDVFGNSIKTVQARFEEMQAQMGQALLPVLGELTEALAPIITELAPVLTQVFKALSPAISAITDNLGPLIDALMPLMEPIIAIAELFGSLIEKLLPPIIDLFGALTPIINDLVAILVPLAEQVLQFLSSVLSGQIVPVLKLFATIIQVALIPVIEFLADIIGNYVMPVLQGFAQVWEDVLGPAIEDFISYIMPALPQLQSQFGSVFEAIANAVQWAWDNVLVPVFGGIMDFFRDVLGIDLGFLEKVGTAFAKGFTTAQNSYNAKDMNPYAQPDYLRVIEEQTAAAGMKAGTSFGQGVSTALSGTGAGATKARNAWKELFEGFAEDVRKQEAQIKLASLGLSEALIDKILGDADWQKIYERVVKGGAKTANNLQNSFNKTTDGLEEMAEAAEKAQDALDKANEELADFMEQAESFNADLANLFKTSNPFAALLDQRGEYERQVGDSFTGFYEKISEGLKSGLFDDAVAEELSMLTAEYEQQLSTIAKRVDDINKELEDLYAIREAAKAFSEGMKDILEATKPLARVELEIGRFEAQVISSFDAVNAKIEDGLKIGLFSEAVANELRSAATQTRTLLTHIARQRDQLAKTYSELTEKLQASKDFREATKNAILGVANITTIGKTARTMIRNLSKTVERTDRFRDQLSTLQQMGLNKEAYNQIVNSGLDAGTATAKAILRGGPEAVNEINNLFSKLEIEADALASDAEKYMFDGGEEAIQGFIDGIVAQDEELRRTAETEAEAFNTTFQFAIDLAETNLDSLISSLESERDSLIATATSLANAFNERFQSIVNASFSATQGRLEQGVSAAEAVVAKPDNSAAIAALDVKIANAERYIRNINNDRMEAGALVKLQDYIAQREALVNAASGGYIRGAGTSTSDSIPAMLSNGEFVMNAAAVDKFGTGFMSAINSGRVPEFARGGMVGNQVSRNAPSRTVINNKYEISVRAGVGDPAAIGKQVVSAIAAYEKTSGRKIIG